MLYGPPPPEVQIQDVPKTVYGPPPPDRGMNVVLTNNETGEKISRWIYDEPLMAGRGASMPLPGDNTVSRQHMLFVRKGKDLYVEDHSKNGTYVNGERLHHMQAYHLQRGDSIRVGNTMYIISWGIF